VELDRRAGDRCRTLETGDLSANQLYMPCVPEGDIGNVIVHSLVGTSNALEIVSINRYLVTKC